MQEEDSRQHLADAVQAVVDARRAETEAARHAPLLAVLGQRQLLFVGAAGALMLIWLWVARPPGVFDPAGSASLSAEQREAIARYALYLERARVDQFAADSGRLPATLAAAGDVEPGVAYRADGRDFTLEARNGGIQLLLTNRMDADSFLGDALGRIPKRKAQ